MSQMVSCPVDGCDYKGSIKQVKGHWGGSQDDAHSGAFHKAFNGEGKQYNNGMGHKAVGPNDTAVNADNTSSTTSSTTAQQSGAGANPTMPDGDGSPEPNQSNTEKVDLPCGHDSYDPSEAPEKPFRITCTDCKQTWRVS